jgi:hypothetical protein
MGPLGLHVLDIGFFVLHSGIILFNVFGWIWARTRRANLVLLSLTLVSWLLMGAVYGVGYCVCTDLHFRVRHALGYQDLGDSYISFLVWKATNLLPPEHLVRLTCASVFSFCLVMSVSLNARDLRRARLARLS